MRLFLELLCDMVLFSLISVTFNIEKDREFEKAISKYPSSFDLKLTPLTKPRINSIRDKLLGKLENGFIIHEEEMQVYNLISYLSFRLGKVDVAFDYNDRVLKQARKNGIALANRTRFNRTLLHFSESEENFYELERLYDVDNAAVTVKIMAEGELAQSYARFGPKFHELAISKYESIFKAAPKVCNDVLLLWKHDYCLCLRRTLHLFTKPDHPNRDSNETIRTACMVLSEIIDTSHLQVYTARAWTELGQLTYSVERMPESFELDILECIPAQKRCDSSKDYFDIALELGRADFDVLEACAKVYRYYNKLKLAVRLFEEALTRRQTSLVYHHLALCVLKIESGRISRRKSNRKKRQKAKLASGNDKMTLTLFEREQFFLGRRIKCKRDVTPLDLNEKTMQVLTNLEKAVELNPFNHFAMYDKGVLLRQLRRTEDARKLFCTLIKGLEVGELKVSCYEQAGYCCLDMAEVNKKDSMKHNYGATGYLGTGASQLAYSCFDKVQATTKQHKKNTNDAIHYFQRAIEVAAVLVAKVKYTSLAVRPLLPTVKMMLTTPKLLEIHDIQMQRLQNLLIQYSNLLPVTAEVSSGSVKTLQALLEKCLQEDRRDDAVLVCILNEIAAEEDEGVFAEHLTVILSAASTSLSNEEYGSAVTRYQICFGLMGHRTHKESREYDAFVMTDGESENLEPMHLVCDWLSNYCGLNIVNSDEHCSTGEPTLNALTNFSQISTAVFVVLKNKKIDYLVEFVVTAIISMPPKMRPKLIILKDKIVELPLAWTNIPVILLPPAREKYSESTVSEWISGVFKCIIYS